MGEVVVVAQSSYTGQPLWSPWLTHARARISFGALTNRTSALRLKASFPKLREHVGGVQMTNGTRQMTTHVEAAYKDAVENINFLKRQQWVATNYAVLVYAAIFVISGTYFSRTDFARNMLGIVTLVTFVIHWYMIYVFQRAIQRYRRRLDWVYQTYFSQDERVGLDLSLGPTVELGPTVDREQWEVATGLVLVSLVGAVFTAIYLWSVRT